MTTPITAALIAPCGINCGICSGHLRTKNTCPGCRAMTADGPTYCRTCSIRTCAIFEDSGSKYCFDCFRFPCPRLRQLDKRYRTRYGTSILANLEYIRRNGIRKFVASERQRWACPHCGGLMCVHRAECPGCGATIRRLGTNEEPLDTLWGPSSTPRQEQS
jgi:hypothetical protein